MQCTKSQFIKRIIFLIIGAQKKLSKNPLNSREDLF